MTIVDFAGVSWYSTVTGAPPWFDKDWPFAGHVRQVFLPLNPSGGDETLERMPQLNVDLDKVRVAARFTGFVSESSSWLPRFRQQVLVYLDNEWVLLFAPAAEKTIRRAMTNVDSMENLSNAANPVYLKMNNEKAMDYISLVGEVLQPSMSQDEDEEDENESIASKHEKLSTELLNLCELLIAWGVPNSSSWPQLTSEFHDLEVLTPYLVDRGVLFSGGTHPSHSPTDSAMVMLAKKWLELPRDKGGPASKKQSTFVATIAKENRGISWSELAKMMTGWDEPGPCAKSAAKRLNAMLQKTNQQWRVDPSNAGRCRIVEASSLEEKTAKRKA